ncbi:MAG: serine hydrolase family protein [Candidatus Kerfeldbacteria bacterium]|nr:serine hydrolase family protein [Candidatus Kerfeldbacteria bacterium]
MKKRVFIIHGWDDSPAGSWFPWLKSKLEDEGWQVEVPAMPDPGQPDIGRWVEALADAVGEPEKQTYFVGHSVGCQTIIRYLERLPSSIRVGGAVLVGGWLNLKPAAIEDNESKAIAEPWLTEPIDWSKVRAHLPKVIAIMSDNDPYVPLSDGALWQKNLAAELVLERQKGHMNSDGDGVTELPSALEAIHRLVGK